MNVGREKSGVMGGRGGKGPIVKISSTPVIQGPNGSISLMIPSSSNIAPNVSVSPATSGLKRLGPTIITIPQKERKTEPPAKAPKPQPTKEDVSLKADLSNIMYAYGDGSTPCEASVNLMEIILTRELEAFLFICDSAAHLSRTKSLGLKEYVYAMRSDTGHLARLLKYLAQKDYQEQVIRFNQLNGQRPTGIPSNGYAAQVRTVFEHLGLSKDLEKHLNYNVSTENARRERALRPDRINQRLNTPKYITFTQSRNVPFARKLVRLADWVEARLHSTCKIPSSFLDLLGFLIYEFVAHLVDLAYTLKREKASYTDPTLQIRDPRYGNPDTCMSDPLFQKRRSDDWSNVTETLVTASEIEAKRLNSIPDKAAESTLYHLSPDEISGAYIRLQQCKRSSMSFISRANNRRKPHFQY